MLLLAESWFNDVFSTMSGRNNIVVDDGKTGVSVVTTSLSILVKAGASVSSGFVEFMELSFLVALPRWSSSLVVL